MDTICEGHRTGTRYHANENTLHAYQSNNNDDKERALPVFYTPPSRTTLPCTMFCLFDGARCLYKRRGGSTQRGERAHWQEDGGRAGDAVSAGVAALEKAGAVRISSEEDGMLGHQRGGLSEWGRHQSLHACMNASRTSYFHAMSYLTNTADGTCFREGAVQYPAPAIHVRTCRRFSVKLPRSGCSPS